MSAIEDTLREVRQAAEKVGDEIKRTAEDALRQSKEAGQVSAETKSRADELLVEQTKVKAKLEALEERVQAAEQRADSRETHRGEAQQSIGQQVAQSEQLKAYLANGAQGSVRIPVRQVITSGAASAGALVAPERDQLVALPRRRLRIRQLLNQGRTGSNLVEYARQTTRTNNAAAVAENTLKPESNYAWELADAPVRTIAHFTKIARQALDDADQLQTEVETELVYGLDLVEEDELLNGDGTGQHLTGLATVASAYVAAFTPDSPTPIDILRLAILQLELADHDFDGAVLNPTEWAKIELTKDSTGGYVLANPLQLQGPVLWGRPIVSTTAQAAGDFLVGAFQRAATIYDRMDAEVLFSTEDADNFQKNMVTARAEKRLAMAVKRAAAMVKGSFPPPAP